MKQFNGKNVTNTKQFKTAISDVFTGIGGRFNQIQDLLIVAVEQAATTNDAGQVGNNLNWLSELMNKAITTKGISYVKIEKYIKEVLCLGTVSFNHKTGAFSKKVGKDELCYSLEPKDTWFNYKSGAPKPAFDYGNAVTTACKSAMNEKKGGLDLAHVLGHVMAAGITEAQLGDALAAMVVAAQDVEWFEAEAEAYETEAAYQVQQAEWDKDKAQQAA